MMNIIVPNNYSFYIRVRLHLRDIDVFSQAVLLDKLLFCPVVFSFIIMCYSSSKDCINTGKETDVSGN